MSHLITLIEHYGLALVFVNVLLLQAGLPVPAYPTLIVTGALAARSPYTLAGARRAPRSLASVIADLVWYMIGRRLGGRVLKTLCRMSLSPDSCVRQTESIFTRWGARVADRRQVRPGIRVGRDRDGGHRAPFAVAVRRCSTRSARRCGRAWRSRSATSSATRSTMCSTCCPSDWAGSASC